MISVSIILDTRSTKIDGTSPLKLRIIHKAQTYHISLGKLVLANDWNDGTEKRTTIAIRSIP